MQGPLGGVSIGNDVSLYRSAERVLAADAGIAVADGLVLTSVDKAVAKGTYTVAHVGPARRLRSPSGGGLRGLLAWRPRSR